MRGRPAHVSVSSAGAETITARAQHLALILAASLAARIACASAAAPDECLAAWQVSGTVSREGNVAVSCRDGDASCDDDGVADGTCRIQVALCLNVSRCAPGTLGSVALRGAAAEPLAARTAALRWPVGESQVCTEPTALTVSLGSASRRSTTVQVQVRDTAAARSDRDRLRLTCRRLTGGRAIVVTTDFETGALATAALRSPRRVTHPPARIHSDAVIRVSGGMVFVLNRFLGDNVQRLEARRGLRTRYQCSTGTGSNPHDLVAVAPDKAYVTRYDRPELWIVDPSVASCERFRRGTIDLAGFADADGLPEMDQMAAIDGRLFVSVQRLDRRRGWVPAGSSALVVIDLSTDRVVGEIPLRGTNPFGDASGIAREPGTDQLVVSSVGDIYRVGDGGLERVDPRTLQAEGRFFVDEATLGGNVLDFLLLSAAKGYAIVQDADLRNRLIAFDPSGARPPRTLYTRRAFLPDLALGPDGLLWVADQDLSAPGIRLFDPLSDTAVLRKPLALGLPPFSIGFLP